MTQTRSEQKQFAGLENVSHETIERLRLYADLLKVLESLDGPGRQIDIAGIVDKALSGFGAIAEGCAEFGGPLDRFGHRRRASRPGAGDIVH